MKELKINVASQEAVISDILSGNNANISVYSFPSYDDLHRTLTPKRIAIVDAMAGKGPLSMREIARLVGRDFKGVHTDITALVNIGLIDRDESGKVVLPFDELHIDISLHAHAA
ncbi:hypothetical protein F9K79_19895 [Ochrobactrum sp. Kaboul]|nr:hypothetical protein F9K79_19895 [Ochrobactrum sp. Kaboul]